MLGSPDDGVPVLRTRSGRLRSIVMPLVILSVIGVVALLLAGRGQETKIIGSGSTLAQPLIERSAVAFRDTQLADNPSRAAQTGNDWVLDGSGIQYEPVGSLGGIQRLADPEVDFAVTDYPLSADALTRLEAVQFPIALGAVRWCTTWTCRQERTAPAGRPYRGPDLPGPDHPVEQPGDRRTQPRKQPARHRHQRGAPQRRFRLDLRPHSLPHRRQRRVGRGPGHRGRHQLAGGGRGRAERRTDRRRAQHPRVDRVRGAGPSAAGRAAIGCPRQQPRGGSRSPADPACWPPSPATTGPVGTATSRR